MLPRPQRLTRQRDIHNVLRRGRLIATPHTRLHLLPRPRGATSRAACLVAKRVSASAVRRHRYQRWLRAALRDALPRLNQPFDIVIAAAPSLNQLEQSRELRAELAAAFSRLRP